MVSTNHEYKRHQTTQFQGIKKSYASTTAMKNRHQGTYYSPQETRAEHELNKKLLRQRPPAGMHETATASEILLPLFQNINISRFDQINIYSTKMLILWNGGRTTKICSSQSQSAQF